MPQDSAAVITVLNLKGGVGKTHTAWVLASVAEERRQRILLVDLDTQTNLTRSFIDSVTPRSSVAELFNPAAELDVVGLIRRTAFSHIDILPASSEIAQFDESNQTIWEETERHFALVEPVAALRNQYDFIVFDCPPRLSLVSFAALCASQHVIVPLEAADWGAQGITQVTSAVEYVRERFNPQLRLLGYLVSRFRGGRSYQQTYLAGLRNHFGPAIFDTVLTDLALFEKSVTDRIPITLRAPKSPATTIARQFADEVCRRIAEQSQGGERITKKPRPTASASTID